MGDWGVPAFDVLGWCCVRFRSEPLIRVNISRCNADSEQETYLHPCGCTWGQKSTLSLCVRLYGLFQRHPCPPLSKVESGWDWLWIYISQMSYVHYWDRGNIPSSVKTTGFPWEFPIEWNSWIQKYPSIHSYFLADDNCDICAGHRRWCPS